MKLIQNYKKYELLDLSGDLAIRVYGADLESLFINAAFALYDAMIEDSIIGDSTSYDVSTQAENRESLLVQWLNELLFLFDAYGFVGNKFELKFNGNSLKAIVKGGVFDPEIHESGLLVKAATYHNLEVKETASGFEAMVLLDL